MDDSGQLAIYSVTACPYAHRTRILLCFKGLKAEMIEIDISKPRSPSFLKLNPSGKVPVLVHLDRPLNESSVIGEYIEEVFPTPTAFPLDPYVKAQSRILIDYCNNNFTANHYRVLMEQDPIKRVRIEAAFIKNWEWLENFLDRVSPDSDYAFGDFGMADLTYAPFFERAILNSYFWGFEVPDRLTRVARWRQAVSKHPAVLATTLPAEDFLKIYADYSLGYSNGTVPAGHERSSLDLTVPVSARPLPPRRIQV